MPQPGPYQVGESRNQTVVMRDGVKLAADIFYPTVQGEPLQSKVPAVLFRTAYNRSGSAATEASYFASHGYLAITQDVRGTFESEGEFFAFVNEHNDGVDTLDWITRLPGCNGSVGMWGCSYMSWVQLAVATQSHPALKCLIPFGVAIDTFDHYAYPQGCLQLGLLRWVIFDVWARAARNEPELLEKIQTLDFLRFAGDMPWQRGQTLLSRSPQFEEMIFAYTDHRTRDDFWKQPGQGFELYFDRFPDIPMLWVSGWWDGYPRSACQGFGKLSDMGRGNNQFLLLGPWIHNQLSGQTAGNVDYSPNAHIDRLDTMRTFFDGHLKGDPQAPRTPRVRAFIMGGGSGRRTETGLLHAGGRWWHGTDWPPREMTPQRWYLQSDGGLSDQPASDDSTTTYVHDPSDPVPSIAPPWNFVGYQPRGPHDQREPSLLTGKGVIGRQLADRADVCVFMTPPLEEDLTLLGPLEATIYVSSSSRDTDLAVKLVDVYPPTEDDPEGYGMPVAEGMLKLRYRDGNDQGDSWIEPGVVYEARVECFPASNRFLKGHRLRVDIASTNFPRHEINREGGVTHNTLHHGKAYPSHIVLPVFNG